MSFFKKTTLIKKIIYIYSLEEKKITNEVKSPQSYSHDNGIVQNFLINGVIVSWSFITSQEAKPPTRSK